ncbi:MAG: dihydrodipicolinate reductase [Ilumatobacteraceae bacterium]|nr:dihydrodipicolinate reductase [Ilumatobacteraceae bacterium]
MTIRVAVWGSGGVGAHAIRAISERPDLELVGVWVHSPHRDGIDAGVLAGGAPIGVVASTDPDVVLAARPDCVCYTASGPAGDAIAVPDYVRFLEAGIDVVTVSTAALVYPPAYDAANRALLQSAAVRGGASLYASGIEPGFAADQFVLTMLTMSHRVRSVRIQELFRYDAYPVEFVMREVFGFGQPMDHRPIMAHNGAQAATWAAPVRMIADAMDVELDGIRETYERVLTPRRLEVACGVIEAGTVGAVRFETIGVVDGRDAIIVEHVNRMAMDLAPEWPNGALDGTYHVDVEGDPEMHCDFKVGGPDTGSVDGMLATAMRIVNAIPAVRAAAPGLLSSLDLPLTLPRHAFAPRAT